MKTIICDVCGHEQKFKPKTEPLDDGVERVCLECGDCGKEYPSHYTDEEIRKLQARQRKIKRTIGKYKGNRYSRMYEEYEMNKIKIKAKMEGLKAMVEYTPGVKPID